MINDDQSILDRVKETLQKHQFEYIETVGKGGFSSVHLVFSMKYQQNFCLKLIDIKTVQSNSAETETILRLHGPNIIKMYGFFEDEYFLYMILEHCEGGSLKDYIKQNGPLPRDLLVNICAQLLLALKQCHSIKVAHRDIKPSNILIDANGRVKLADFGLSRHYDVTLEKSDFSGSYAFMSPEVIFKKSYNPFAADIWALGVTFYYLWQGQLPWIADQKSMQFQISMAMINFSSEVYQDSDLARMIRLMVSRSPSKRPTVEWLLDSLMIRNELNKPTVMLNNDQKYLDIEQLEHSHTIGGFNKLDYSRRNLLAKSSFQPTSSLKLRPLTKKIMVGQGLYYTKSIHEKHVVVRSKTFLAKG